jgi:hypothetical protein
MEINSALGILRVEEVLPEGDLAYRIDPIKFTPTSEFAERITTSASAILFSIASIRGWGRDKSLLSAEK